MKVKWTKADAKRARKMGWNLVRFLGDDPDVVFYTGIKRDGPRFKSDDEAIEFVIDIVEFGAGRVIELDIGTCRKALLLCAKG